MSVVNSFITLVAERLMLHNSKSLEFRPGPAPVIWMGTVNRRALSEVTKRGGDKDNNKCLKKKRRGEKKSLRKHCHLSVNLQWYIGAKGPLQLSGPLNGQLSTCGHLREQKKKKIFPTSTLHLSISTTLQHYCWSGTTTVPLLEQTSVRF